MNPADYYDWWLYSGICPGDPTRPANIAVLRERLSAPGLDIIILKRLLDRSTEYGETTYHRPEYIHGADQRIAASASNVGAVELARYMAAPAKAGVVPEAQRSLKKLLKQFAIRHQAELANDIARHGDPRAVSGFNKRLALKKVDREWGANNEKYILVDQIPFYEARLGKLRELLAQGLMLAEIGRLSDEMARLELDFRYQFTLWGQSPQPPAVARFLDACRRLTEEFPDGLPPWPPRSLAYAGASAGVSQNPRILGQLQSIGAYRVTSIGPLTMIEWDSVPGLASALGPMGLRFSYEGQIPPTLVAAWTGVRALLTTALPAMRQALLADARARARRGASEEALLADINRGVLTLASDTGEAAGYRIECWWEVEWDPEHGCTFEIAADGRVRRTE